MEGLSLQGLFYIALGLHEISESTGNRNTGTIYTYISGMYGTGTAVITGHKTCVSFRLFFCGIEDVNNSLVKTPPYVLETPGGFFN